MNQDESVNDRESSVLRLQLGKKEEELALSLLNIKDPTHLKSLKFYKKLNHFCSLGFVFAFGF